MSTPRLARRGMLGASAAALGVAAVPETADAAPLAVPQVAGRRTWGSTSTPTATERHVLNRFTYGFCKKEFRRLRAAGGSAAWFERQLNPSAIADPKVDELLGSLPDLYLPPAEQALQGNTRRKDAMYVQQQYFAATVARRVYSTRQVQAMMADFWTNHFYVPGQLYLHADYSRTLRGLALGRFEDILVAAELHPAMLLSLSTASSTKEHPNENQARELMELHTLGRGGGGYTEATVQTIAKLLTGWTVDSYEQSYDPARHWTGPLRALGWSNANTSADGRDATRSWLRYLAHHPATAERICRKLAVRFVSDDPSDALVASLAKVYLDNDTQIKPVLRAIYRHSEFQSARGKKLRTPMEDCVGMLRATSTVVFPVGPIGVGNSAFLNLAWAPGTAGQPLLGWPRPDGWPDVASAWDGPARAESMLKWHWTVASRGDRTFEGASRISGPGLLPQRTMRFDQYVDHLARRLLGMPATDRLVRAACAATGCTIGTSVGKGSVALNEDWPRLLVTFFDSPDWLWK